MLDFGVVFHGTWHCIVSTDPPATIVKHRHQALIHEEILALSIYPFVCFNATSCNTPSYTHIYLKIRENYISFGLPPLPVTVANEGLVRDPLLKMFHNPGGDWNPGRGDNPIYPSCIFLVYNIVGACFCIWVFPKIMVSPKWMVKIMENPIKMG